MKVFKMNECDWVAANNVIEAIKWYEDWTGYDWTEDFMDIDPVECDLDTPMKIYPSEHRDKPPAIMTLREYMEIEKNRYTWFGKEPYLILSTEY